MALRPPSYVVDALERATAEIVHEADCYLTHGGPDVRERFLDDFEQTSRRIAQAPRSFRGWPGNPSRMHPASWQLLQ